MTFGADLSFTCLPRWETQGCFSCRVFPSCFILLSSAAGSQWARCQGGELQRQPVQGKVLSSCSMGLLGSQLSSLWCHLHWFTCGFSLLEDRRGNTQAQYARRQKRNRGMSSVWQRTDYAALPPALPWLQSIYALVLQISSQKSLLLVLPACISKRIICILNQSSSPQKRPSLCLLQWSYSVQSRECHARMLSGC